MFFFWLVHSNDDRLSQDLISQVVCVPCVCLPRDIDMSEGAMSLTYQTRGEVMTISIASKFMKYP